MIVIRGNAVTGNNEHAAFFHGTDLFFKFIPAKGCFHESAINAQVMKSNDTASEAVKLLIQTVNFFKPHLGSCDVHFFL